MGNQWDPFDLNKDGKLDVFEETNKFLVYQEVTKAMEDDTPRPRQRVSLFGCIGELLPYLQLAVAALIILISPAMVVFGLIVQGDAALDQLGFVLCALVALGDCIAAPLVIAYLIKRRKMKAEAAKRKAEAAKQKAEQVKTEETEPVEK
jgi:hypothetical protein